MGTLVNISYVALSIDNNYICHQDWKLLTCDIDFMQVMAGTPCRPRLRQLNEVLLLPILVLYHIAGNFH